MQLTIVIPTFNEAENLPKLVSALFTLPIPEKNVLIVDDNSPDGTGQVAEQLRRECDGQLFVIHRERKMGLGTAYIEGFHWALEQGSEAIAEMDSDFSHPPEKLVSLLEALHVCDIAVGSRYVAGGAVDEHWPLWRKTLSAFGNYYARAILRLPLRDVTGGFRIYRRHVLLSLPLERVRSNGYAFQVEMAYLAHRLGFTFLELPIYFADRRWGQSKMSLSVQLEAAGRVWQMLLEYRDLKGTA